MLARKGYSGGVAAAVVREALDATDDGADHLVSLDDEDALLP